MSAGLQRALVLALVACACAFTLPEFAWPWAPVGSFGMQFSADGKVLDVTPQSPATRAGIRIGDRLDIAATPVHSRQWIGTGIATAPLNISAPFVIVHGGKSRTVLLRVSPRSRSLLDNVTNTILVAALVAFIAIAAALCFVRPSRMTWAFLMYAMFITTWVSASP